MKKRKRYIIPVFIPQQGCPFQCIYCNQYAITGMRQDILSQADKILRQAILTAPSGTDIEVAFYGGTFTAMPQDVQESLLKLAASYRQYINITDIRLSTRPDYINPPILDMLSHNGVTVIELGAQSMDDAVLHASGRGHSSKDVEDAAYLIKEYDIKLGIQLMVGLPSDDAGKDMRSVIKAIDIGADFIRIYPTLVIKDTPLERLYLKGRYKPLSLYDAVTVSAGMLCVCIANDIPVIRIGLQPSDGIQLGKDVVTGPFHPAFGELVKSHLYLDAIKDSLKSVRYGESDAVILRAHPSELSIVLGQKRSNVRGLMDLGLKKVDVIPSSDVEAGNIQLEIASCGLYNMSIKDYCRRRCEGRI
ncbi:elongator complex protein 3 [Mahella australiensis]|uniref:Radical SAM domain protein n=1 Tax=Mahella australiensis (strain DSM 15567 / CIP 107919 / 50-1 BON) TaxID=697281 RepID=F4A2S0_MAHA5|nr:radical SAM protein [Mahella australiensis]AEE96250.1 Radical SAM domain protein [Mahella australiensis 50-1 BON]